MAKKESAMWYRMRDGSMVNKVPDGWRVRNPNNTYMHVRDCKHSWAEAKAAVEAATANDTGPLSRIKFDPKAWTAACDLSPIAKESRTAHVAFANLLRLAGGVQEKRCGVRGWSGIAIADAS
jgi:hypothetical protein